ncbi:plasmid recombination protein [Lachnospiraceae bacterium MD1]|uniref:Plasmid recombination protein n=1 Tax=Variimorphobacter saccharofermentans TaxID=2755051 RepID=A0A839K0S0_9FIRM|nr:MobV family relaxase [Variimorphobacter saccharofermentans]MBB2182782.1 plasmid recombination protein [Variimorphobacter saccharofermentans]
MPVKNYAILRTQKLNRKNIQEVKKRCEHVNRIEFTENVNKELSHLDRCVIGDSDSDWFKLFKTRFKELEHYKDPSSRKLNSNAVIGVEAVTTMSHEMGDKIDIDGWIDANNKWMQDYFGKDNVLHGVLHMDEVTPHIHYFITPVLDGKFNAREIMGGRNKYRDRQTEYAKAMEPFGLQRGLKTGRTDYVTIKELYAKNQNIINLPDISSEESAEEYRIRINKQYRALQIRIGYLEREVKDHEVIRDYAAKLEEETDKLQEKYNELRDRNKRLEHNFKYRRLGNYLVEDLIYAVENYDDKNVIDNYLTRIAPLNEWGKQYNDRIDREGEHKSIEEGSVK